MSAQLEKHGIPGAVLVVVRDGHLAFARGYGYADLERRIAVDADRTIFRVASVSKLFTATAAMQLVEQGKLDLHADVNTYLEKFQVPASYPRPVTLFDLLTHTAGFDEKFIRRKAYQPSEVGPLGDYLARQLPARVRPPGEIIVYSNHGMALAGYLVEVASGMPFERYMKERIFGPLGMTHSSFAVVPDSVIRMATGYQGKPARAQRRDYTKTIPASMLSTTGTDAARFMIAHLEGGAVDGVRLLSEASTDAMHRRQFTQDPRLLGVGLGFWERFKDGERAVWHDGDAVGFASLMYLVPERRTGYFMAFNSRAGGVARSEILTALTGRESLHGGPVATPRRDARAAAGAARFAGTYVDARSGHRTLEKIITLMRQRRLVATPEGDLRFEDNRYVAVSPGFFESENGKGHLAFRQDPSGRVTHLFESWSIIRALERVAWHGTVPVQLAWLGLCLIAFLWQVSVSIYRAIARRKHAPATTRGAGGWAGRALTIVSGLHLVAVAGLAMTIAGAFGGLEYGVPRILFVLLTLPIVAGAITITALPGFAAILRREGARGRVRLGAALAAALAFIPWLAYWHLLGYSL